MPSVPGAILILDDDADMLASLVDFARTLSGRKCVAVASYDALIALAPHLADFSVAILDINLGAGRPNGIDAYRWLLDERFPGRIYFLTGHARNHPLVEEARRLGNVEIIEKPAGIGTLERAFSAA
jgi:ActR/RegA family two-component response regulator